MAAEPGLRARIDAWSRPVVGLLVFALLGGLAWLLLRQGVAAESRELLVWIFGQVVGMALMIVGYHYGSSSGSKDKDDGRQPVPPQPENDNG